MKNIIAIMATVILGPAIAEVPIGIQHKLMDLSGLSPIVNIPKLETTDQRNQFFDNYSVLSIPEFKAVDQMQLQNIQTFSPSHRKVSLEGLNKIKDITSGLVTQDIVVTPEDFRGVNIQDGNITIPDIANKSQQVRDILEAANTVLQEVKSLNQKELNSLKLTISDMRNLQKIVLIIQQQLNRPTFKGGKVNGISVDVDTMAAEIISARKELNTLIPNLTFADFDQLQNVSTSSNGKLILPNYNKDAASDNLNRFIEIAEQGSKYVDAGLLSTTTPSINLNLISNPSHEFAMKGADTISGKQNGFLNTIPELGTVSESFFNNVNNQPKLNWGGQSAGPLSQTVNTVDGFQMLKGAGINNGFNTNLINPVNTDLSAFDYMTNTSFVTIDSFQNKPLLPFPNINLNNDLGGLCAIGTTCRQKLSIGDLNGAMNEIMSNLPEDVRPR
ncbi:MAG: hypothetical protein ISR69_11130 [Gammaproteobacteria bacterium]|nr:hypothetical protein [Gammaproteobacteria bacterium]